MKAIDENDTLFPLGHVVATRGSVDRLGAEEVHRALSRHAHGDWGDVCKRDRHENEISLREGFRLFSVFHTKEGQKFWIITEADRSVTTVLLPEEY